ncbi:hypothetical protein [Nonomuraea salmonea]|uniref:Uncharacterized protein n=1 Tax=Nonomuraea salmonea TaxID=46181 RepID=A0ABV5NX96_9ACTN
MFHPFEGLDDQTEQDPVERALEGPDGDVVEAEPGKRLEPVIESLVREVDGCPMVVFSAGPLDARVEVMAGGVEGVQDGVLPCT